MTKPAEQGKHRHHGCGMRGGRWLAALLIACASLPAFAEPPVRVDLSYRGLEFDFSQAMQVWDNDAQVDAVALHPSLPLRCHWNDDTTLYCTPAEGAHFAKATRYDARVAAGLKTQTGEVLPAQKLSFETERPTIGTSIDRWNAGIPVISIGSNVETDEREVKRVLRISIDGRPVAFSLTPSAPTQWRSEGHFFDLHLPAMDEGMHRLVVAAVPGLRSDEGPLRGTQDGKLLAALVNEPFALRGVSCIGPQGAVSAQPQESHVRITCPARQPIWLEFSGKMDAESLSRFERALPPGVRLSKDENGFYRSSGQRAFATETTGIVALEVEDAGASATLELDARLHSTDRDDGLQPVAIELHAGDFQPSLRGRFADALIADGSESPILAEAFNARGQRLQARSLGAIAQGAEVQVPANAHGKPQPLHSADTERALADGGWAMWAPVAKRDRYSDENSIQFAAPGFDLRAVSGRRELLAWANAWENGAPVAGARVELLYWDDAQAKPRNVASGLTGNDGVALLHLPDGFVLPDDDEDGRHGRWLVRATRRDGAVRSVLPIEGGNYWFPDLGEALERKTWGVSDRPIYHAGDTVHYRLWQRDLRGTRLQAIVSTTPITLHLRNERQEKDILTWEAKPDGEGGIAGELPLPVHLTDATYCIGPLQRDDVRGACFYVGTYRAQDLWVNAISPDARVLRDDEPFALDIEAGYYSGGPAVGMQVDEIQSGLWPLPLQEAYPQYRDYAFIDAEDDDTVDEPLAGLGDIDLRLDANGKAHLELKATFDVKPADRDHLPAFAKLAIGAGIKPQDREATTSNEVELRYAHFDRYVGLRVVPEWIDATTPVRLTGIVIDAQGKQSPVDGIEVEVDYLPGFMDEAKPERIAQCTLHAERESTCDFARTRSGRYRLTARSGDAAPAEVTRYVWIDDDAGTEAVKEPEIEMLGPAGPDGMSRRVMLKQPHAHARVLFVMRAGDKILGHLASRVDGTAQAFILPMHREGRGQVDVQAIVCDAAPSQADDGYRGVPDCDVATMEHPAIEMDRGQQDPAVGVRFDRDTAHPGDTVHVIVSNPTRQKRSVVLSIMDDALRAQATRWLPYADPLGGDWLESARRGPGSLDITGFEGWNRSDWAWMLPWPPASKHDTAEAPCTQVDAAERAACQAQAAADAAAAGPAEPVVVFDEPSPMDVPAPAPDGYGYAAADASTLDRVTVTGSRITRTDLESTQGGAPPKGLRFDREHGDSASSMRAGVRFRFADTALWRPDLQLAPGETRSIDFKLPDNLTRWRAVAWSSDAGDDFAMADAALETGLPLEVRLQTPVRLYPGDQARIAANVRQSGDAPMEVRASFEVAGTAAPLRQEASVALPARGEGSVAMRLSPTETGSMLVTTAVQANAAHDAVVAPIEIASPTIEGRKLQAGWLDAAPLVLDLPALPQSASAVRVDLSLHRGASGLIDAWTHDLRDYPHRCWEQILSRAVAAALALRRGDDQWPDARAVVQEALANAAVFQDDEGGFRYFVEQSDDYGNESKPSVALTAYTARALSLLKELGYQVDAGILESANDFLESNSDPKKRNGNAADSHAIELAFAASEAHDVAPATLDMLWQRWSKLPLPAQLAALRAFASHSNAAARPAARELLERAAVHGSARTLSMASGDDAWMGSDMQEQCSLVELLGEYPALAEPGMRRSLVRGLSDLYAGGVDAVDTQTGAGCLIALRDLAESNAEDAGSVRFGIGGQSLTLHLAARQQHDQGSIESPAGPRLRIDPELRGNEVASYVAELRYMEDARVARASAIGLAIERRYEVLRDGAWVPVAQATLHEGDWIRITLVVDSGAARHFVALTDAVPGGLRPTDLSLAGVGGFDLHKVDDVGSGYFATRRLDARNPKFYAEYLPAGRHEVHYFTLVGNSGDYLAAPAVVELMYGKATRARTAATRLVVPDREDGTKP